jgi:DNA 3'-phosphatase
MGKLFQISFYLLMSFCQAEDLGRRKLSAQFDPKGANKIKVAFFDADSTLRIAPSGSVSASGPRDTWLLPNVTREIARLNDEGYVVAIVSNQAGVPKHVSLENADQALDHIRQMAQWLNPKALIHYYDFAELRDNDRKPGTGMFERFERTLKDKFGDSVTIDREKSFLIGDSLGKPGRDFSDSDLKAAENFGIKAIDPADFFQWKKYGKERFNSKKEIDDFFEANPELRGTGTARCPFPSLIKKN